MEKIYICDCGKEFTDLNKYRGHKNHCEAYFLAAGKYEEHKQKIDQRRVINRNTLLATIEKRKIDNQTKKDEKLQKWVSEQHRCEKCGKIMTGYYGSGRFCCKSCANSHQQSEETRQKISASRKEFYETGIYSSPSNYVPHPKTKIEIKKSSTQKKGRIFIPRNIDKTEREKIKQEINYQRYVENPPLCKICGKVIPFEKPYRKTCSDECFHISLSLHGKALAEKNGGSVTPGSRVHSIRGNYKNFHYDSSWELAFIVYSLDHNLNLKRNHKGFPYIYDGKEHKYYPDFIIDDVYYEIKGYMSDVAKTKIAYFPSDLKLKVLQRKEILPYLDYCKNLYGKDFINVLRE